MGAVAAVLPRKEDLRAKAEWPFAVGLVYLRDLLVDDTYQRPGLTKFIADIAQVFDETLVGTIDVSERKSGFAILDGQQRYLAMQIVGKTACYCSIYTGMSIADEAGFFFSKNYRRRNMKPFFSFRARRVAGDEKVIEIVNLVEAQGFTIGESTNERDVIGAIRALEISHSFTSEQREDCLSPALETIRESILGRKGSLDANLIQGLARFWQAFTDQEVDKKLLNEIMATWGPKAFIGLASEHRTIPSSGENYASHKLSLPYLAARTLGREYNRLKRKGHRGSNFPGKLELGRL